MAAGKIGTCNEAERMSRYSPARALSRTRLRMSAWEASSEKVNLSVYIPDCKISLASFVLYFHLLLIRSFIRIRSFSVFVSWFLLQKLNLIGSCLR